ncbi:MAG: DUF4350 domain-containing protein [Bradymonadaceae bacterium]
MSKRPLLILVGLAIATLIVGGAGLFFYTHERVEVSERIPPSGEARHNPYLALSRFYATLGYQTWTERRLPEPDDDRVLIWMARERNISHQDLEVWTRWVRNGGHIVLVEPQDSRDLLLEALGFSYGSSPSEENENGRREVGPYDVPGFGFTRVFWDHPAVDWEALSADARIIARSRPLDAGRVTLISSREGFENNSIGDGDSAALAADIIALEPVDDGWITIVLFGQRVSWMAHIASTFWPVLLALAALLLLALSLGFHRYGPLRPQSTGERRSRVEHIEAMGRFLWTHDAMETLLNATREALIADLARKRPSIQTLHDTERHTLIAEELKISLVEARRLLMTPAPRSPNVFFQTINTLEQHRRSL